MTTHFTGRVRLGRDGAPDVRDVHRAAPAGPRVDAPRTSTGSTSTVPPTRCSSGVWRDGDRVVGLLAARPARRTTRRRSRRSRWRPRLIELCFQTAGICGDRHDRPHGAAAIASTRSSLPERRTSDAGRLFAVVDPTAERRLRRRGGRRRRPRPRRACAATARSSCRRRRRRATSRPLAARVAGVSGVERGLPSASRSSTAARPRCGSSTRCASSTASTARALRDDRALHRARPQRHVRARGRRGVRPRARPLFVDARDGRRKSSYLDYDAPRAGARARRGPTPPGWAGASSPSTPSSPSCCERLGIVFVGPPADGHAPARRQDRRQAAGRSARRAGGAVERRRRSRRSTRRCAHAERLGYPLMIKATAGGGGRGIRRVDDADGAGRRRSSQRAAEAAQAFGDATVFLERAARAARATSRSRSSPTATARPGRSACATARSSAATRRSSRSRRRPRSRPSRTRRCAPRPSGSCRRPGYRNAGTVEFLYDPREPDASLHGGQRAPAGRAPGHRGTTGLDLVKLQLHVAARRPARGRRRRPARPRHRGAPERRGPRERLRARARRRRAAAAAHGPGLRVDTGVDRGRRASRPSSTR